MTFHCTGLLEFCRELCVLIQLVSLISWLKMAVPCKRRLWANTLAKGITSFQKGLNMVFQEAYYSALLLIIIYWGVIVHLVMEDKFIFFITWLVFLNWLRCQKEYFSLLCLLFSSNRNIIENIIECIPSPETNKNQLQSILREVLSGESQETQRESWIPLSVRSA